MNPEQYGDLQTELLAGHPVSGVYNVDDLLAATQINVLDRSAPAAPNAILEYMIVNRFRKNTGTDLTAMYIYGRLQMAKNGTVGVDTFGSGSNTLTLDQLISCVSFNKIIEDDFLNLDLLATEVNNMLTDVRNAEVFGAGDKTAIVNLSTDKQSRASELGFGRVVIGDIQNARAL